MLGRGSVIDQQRRRGRSTKEVEAALKGIPAVFDALVEVPDPRYGQQVAAVVQRPGRVVGRRWPSLDSRSVRSEILGYKVPRSLCLSTGEAFAAIKPDYRWAQEQTEARPADDVHAGHVTSGDGCGWLGHPARKVDGSAVVSRPSRHRWMEVRHGCSRASNSCGGFAEAGPHLIDGHRAALPGVAIGWAGRSPSGTSAYGCRARCPH